MSEKQNIEWKQNWRDEYLQWVSAFANSKGGVLIIGKNDRGETVNLSNVEKLLEDIPSKIKSHLGIISAVNLQEDDTGNYIEILTHPYTNPISYKGKFYIRSGATTHEMNGVELSDFLLARSGKSWDEIIVEDASIEDIDAEAIKILISDSDLKRRLPDTVNLSDLEIMQKMRVAYDNQLKRSGVILFAKDPNQFIPNCKVMIGRFGQDSEDLKFQEVVEGNLVYTLREVQSQLNHKFLARPVDFSGMLRLEKDEYPVAALREMLLNALVHKKYGGAAIQLRVFDDRLSIWNEGSLPVGLTIENLRVEHNSKPANPLIADVCFKAGYIDTWGRGTLKIIKACNDAGLPEPNFREKDGGIEVTLFKAKVNASHQDDFGANSEEIRKKFGEISEEIRRSFGRNVQSTFDQIIQNPEYTAEKLAGVLKVTSRTIENHQAKLKKGGFIERIGEKKGGYWKIKKPK